MITRDRDRLYVISGQLKRMIRTLERISSDHRYSLSAREALQHAARLESWLDDLIFVVESERGTTSQE